MRQWLHLKVVSAGETCWLFLRLTLSSSEASCSSFSPLHVELVGCSFVSLSVHRTQAVASRPLCSGCDLVPVSSRNDPGQGLPVRQHPCQGPSCLFDSEFWTVLSYLACCKSPYSRTLKILPSCILRTCPSQRRRRCRSRV